MYVRVNAGYVATAVLAGQLRQALGAPRPEFPFHPHVTVAHHLDDAALDHADDTLRDFECEFDVEEFALYLHDDASGWVPQHCFSLAPRDPRAVSLERREQLVAERQRGQLQRVRAVGEGDLAAQRGLLQAGARAASAGCA